MREWKYRKIALNLHVPRGDDLDLLNGAGADGWELVSITSNNMAYLKRELEVHAPTTGAFIDSSTERVPVKANNEVCVDSVQESAVKYRDPVTRETWSGRGRIPKWLKRKQEGGEDIEEYLV